MSDALESLFRRHLLLQRNVESIETHLLMKDQATRSQTLVFWSPHPDKAAINKTEQCLMFKLLLIVDTC